jgi:hypothetical protein
LMTRAFANDWDQSSFLFLSYFYFYSFLGILTAL